MITIASPNEMTKMKKHQIQKDKNDVINILRRMFNGGVMHRLPKKQQDAHAIRALSLVDLDPDKFYDEFEINKYLSAWLDIIGADDGLSDHVTLRRSLVDFGFLRRASDGAVYRVVPEMIDEYLSADAKLINPKEIFAEVEADRHARSKNFGGVE